MDIEDARDLIKEELGYCSCASEDAILLLKKLLEYFENKKERSWTEMVVSLFSGNEAAAYCATFLCDKAGLIDHGVSLRCSFLNQYGLDFLDVLKNNKLVNILNYEE